MTSTTTGASAPKVPAWGAILTAGLLAGAFDLNAASVMFDVPATTVGHAVASGLLGRKAAYGGGLPTGALGIALHFFILIVAATLYRLAAARVPVLARRPLLCGVLYGLAIFGFMNFVVLPLSLAGTAPWTLPRLARGVLVHLLLVGAPIGLIASTGLPRAPRD
jgi:hypothetical protein